MPRSLRLRLRPAALGWILAAVWLSLASAAGRSRASGDDRSIRSAVQQDYLHAPASRDRTAQLRADRTPERTGGGAAADAYTFVELRADAPRQTRARLDRAGSSPVRPRRLAFRYFATAPPAAL